MKAIKIVFGYVHFGLALTVSVQFLASPMYGGDLNDTVWEIVSSLMAVGGLAALIFSIIRMRESPDPGAKVMFIASLTLFLLFMRLWLSTYVFDSDETPQGDIVQLMWYGIDVLFVLVNFFVGHYLLRTVSRS